jgi:hypothetical protein
MTVDGAAQPLRQRRQLDLDHAAAPGREQRIPAQRPGGRRTPRERLLQAHARDRAMRDPRDARAAAERRLAQGSLHPPELAEEGVPPLLGRRGEHEVEAIGRRAERVQLHRMQLERAPDPREHLRLEDAEAHLARDVDGHAATCSNAGSRGSGRVGSHARTQ